MPFQEVPRALVDLWRAVIISMGVAFCFRKLRFKAPRVQSIASGPDHRLRDELIVGPYKNGNRDLRWALSMYASLFPRSAPGWTAVAAKYSDSSNESVQSLARTGRMPEPVHAA